MDWRINRINISSNFPSKINCIKCNDVAGCGKATAVHILGPKSQDQIAKGHHGCLRGAMRGAIWSIRASQVDQLPLEPS